MNNFKKTSRFSTGGFKRQGGSDFGRNREMHDATCADCGKICRVPFLPNGKKPVYCSDCFPKNGGQVTTDVFPKKVYPSKFTPSPSPSFSKPQNNDKKLEEVTKLLETMNAKFDKLVILAETFVSNTRK